MPEFTYEALDRAGSPTNGTITARDSADAAVKVRASWGTDYLLLGKYDGRWMISHVLWQSQ